MSSARLVPTWPTALASAPTRAVVVLAELRIWPDSSIGCPQDGMQYLQVLTDGAEIVFDVGGGTYRYTKGGQVLIPQLCEN